MGTHFWQLCISAIYIERGLGLLVEASVEFHGVPGIICIYIYIYKIHIHT